MMHCTVRVAGDVMNALPSLILARYYLSSLLIVMMRSMHGCTIYTISPSYQLLMPISNIPSHCCYCPTIEHSCLPVHVLVLYCIVPTRLYSQTSDLTTILYYTILLDRSPSHPLMLITYRDRDRAASHHMYRYRCSSPYVWFHITDH